MPAAQQPLTLLQAALECLKDLLEQQKVQTDSTKAQRSLRCLVKLQKEGALVPSAHRRSLSWAGPRLSC